MFVYARLCVVQFYLLPPPPAPFPPWHTPGICLLDVLFPTPGHTERDHFPPPELMTWTKNKLLRFHDLFLHLNKSRNLKNPKLLEQLTPFRSKANIIKLDTNTNTPGGRFNQTASKIEMFLYKTNLKFLQTMWNNVFCIFSANKLLFYKTISDRRKCANVLN